MRSRRLISSLLVLTISLLCAASVQAASSSAQKAARKAVQRGPAAVRALMRQAARKRDAGLAQALLVYASVQTSESGGARGARIRPGCRGSSSSQHTIKILGITIAWQRVYQNGFCWNGKRITSSDGASVRRYSAAPYCWKDTSVADQWTARPKWRRAWAYGVLGGNAVFGCISLQSDSPYIDYANGGGRWFH